MASLKDIRRRIQSVKKTQQITAAMYMVAAAKLHRTQSALSAMLPYRGKLQEILSVFLQGDTPGVIPALPYTVPRPIVRMGVIVIASDSGLCGAFNANVEHGLTALIARHTGVEVILFPIGKKALEMASHTGCAVVEDYVSMGAKPAYEPLAAMAASLMRRYETGALDHIEILSHHFISMGAQELRQVAYLPIRSFSETASSEQPRGGAAENRMENPAFIMEPSFREVATALLPVVLSLQMYAAVLDSAASEHAARSMAMKLATDNADELLAELTVQYNKSRQTAITNELLDIVAGSMK